MKLTVKIDGKEFAVEIADPNARPMVVNVDGSEFTVVTDNNSVVSAAPAAVSAPKAAPAAGAATVSAPIPGVIQEINVKEGQSVKKGDVLFILEAMKMKNNIVAMHDGTVATIHVSKGDTVKHGQILLSFAG